MLNPYTLNSVPRLPQANSATASAMPPAKVRGASSDQHALEASRTKNPKTSPSALNSVLSTPQAHASAMPPAKVRGASSDALPPLPRGSRRGVAERLPPSSSSSSGRGAAEEGFLRGKGLLAEGKVFVPNIVWCSIHGECDSSPSHWSRLRNF